LSEIFQILGPCSLTATLIEVKFGVEESIYDQLIHVKTHSVAPVGGRTLKSPRVTEILA